MTKEAYQEIVIPLMAGDFMGFTIEKKEIHVKILGKELHTIPKQELLQEFYSPSADASPGNKILSFEFVTPTSFRSNGKYVIMPDAELIFKSLMNKYSAASSDMDMYDDETLQQLKEHTEIIRYQLRSASFPLEGVRIPSFLGKMTVKVGGTDTMARYARLLARFGEYSGVGIKASLGMGGFRMTKGETGK